MKTLAPKRLDYLDAVRAFALLLGIVFHASLSFMPIYIGWAVMDISTSSLVSIFVLISHSFRMELFFLIAGFFSHMTFHKKGSRTFSKTRIVRIAIPWIVGWFILKPLVVSGWVMGGESMRGDVNILSGLKIGFQSLNTLPTGILAGTHLWFLYYILIITAAALLGRALIGLSPSILAPTTRGADKFTTWLASTKLSLLFLAIATSLPLWFMSAWGMDTPDKSLVPQIPTFIVYGANFCLGWILHRQAPLIAKLSQLSIARFILCGASMVGIVVLSAFESDIGHDHYLWIKIAFKLCYALTMWSLVLLTIGLFKKFFDRPNPAIRYVADSSYWLYLVHLPVVLWLQVAFAELPWHWSLKLAAISVITVGLSLLIYDLLIRPTLIGRTLNGLRKKSALISSFQKKTPPSTATKAIS